MVPWLHLDRTVVPGGGELRLGQRGSEFSIMSGQSELMNSRLSGSEQALATLSLARIEDRKAPEILIGGLGMGFTLRAALAVLGPQARVTVAELVPAVIRWARGPMAEIFGNSLADPRLSIIEGDVGGLMRAARSRYDAILLDVDNGPVGLTRESNDGLYSMAGLATAQAALTPGGVLAVWSSDPNKGFSERLRRSGFEVEEARVRASSNGRGARHVIWLAAKRSGAAPRVARSAGATKEEPG